MAPIPATMKAIAIAKNGGPEVLELKDVPVPKPAADEILVRNRIAGVNYIDTYFRSGQYPSPSFPRILGQDGAGEVVAVGGPSAQPQHALGSTVVFMSGTGTYAEYSTVRAASAVALPAGVAAEDAVAVYLQGLTAWTFIRRAALTQAGEWAFVHAAAGGVGSLLVQLLKIVGAKVIATASSAEKLKIVEGLGADHVINSNDDWVAKAKEITGGRGVDSIYDGVGKATFKQDLELIAVGGSLVMLGNAVSGPTLKTASPAHEKFSSRLTRKSLVGQC